MEKRANQTRERILAAAAEIIAEEGLAARLSVRAVATRAGVSVGAMRHHFPTQRDLRDQVMKRIGDWLAPGDWMEDTSLSAEGRLRHGLHQILDQVGTGQQARDTMIRLISTFVAVQQTSQVRQAYLSIEEDGQRRIEGWLDTLAEEGHLATADVAGHARFLGTVLNGLALQRALPASDALFQIEEEIIANAVSAVL